MHVLEDWNPANRAHGSLQAIYLFLHDIAYTELDHCFHLLWEELLCSFDDFFSFLANALYMLFPFADRTVEVWIDHLCLDLEFNTLQDGLDSMYKQRLVFLLVKPTALNNLEFTNVLNQGIHPGLNIFNCFSDHFEKLL